MAGRSRAGNLARYALLGLILFALAAFVSYNWVASSDERAGLAAAPDLSLATLDGDFRLSEQQGKVVVLYFCFRG